MISLPSTRRKYETGPLHSCKYKHGQRGSFQPDRGSSISLQVGAFAFVGIEIPAVTALEARMTARTGSTQAPKRPANRALQFSCSWLPFIVAAIYVAMGMLASANVDRAHEDLPSQNRSPENSTNPATCRRTNSVFVISAMDSGIPGLPDAFTAFIIVTAWTSANTALYVSSRTLYGLFVHLRDKEPQKDRAHRNILYRLGFKFSRAIGTSRKTHGGKRIPVLALILSAIVFCFVPFLQLAHVTTTSEVQSKHQDQ